MASVSSRHQWPPGFRFRPTDQELVAFYLSRKLSGRPIQPGIITEVDLYKCEPWDLPDKSSFENDVEWYFFSPRDKKYPNGSRTNRATEAGYWKATGKDRVVRSCSKGIGMKKTLVFYKGRAPHGQRTDWIMHEYRLEEVDSQQFQDAFVLCRVFRKTTAKNEEEIIPTYLDEEFNCSSSLVPAEKDAPEVLAPAEPDEGQICSPSLTENGVPVPQGNSSVQVSPVAVSGPEDVADDSLDAFLTMLLDEPTPEESQVLALAHSQENPIPREASLEFMDPAFCAFGQEAEMLEQLQESLQGSQNNEVGEDYRYTSGEDFSMMDLLAGDFFELNDLINAGEQDGINQQPVNTSQMPIEDMTTYLENLGPQISRTAENITSTPNFNLHPKVAPSNWMETLQYEREGDALSQITENGVDDINGRSLVSAFPNSSDFRWKSFEVTNIGDGFAAPVAGDLTTELYDMGLTAESGLQTAEVFLSSVDTGSVNTSAEGGTMNPSGNDQKQHHPLKRFLNMLGSVHVLPASAAEYPSESRLKSKLVLKGSSASTDNSIHLTAMNLCVTAVTFTCNCPKKHHDGETKQASACITGLGNKLQRGYGGNLFFVFLLGSMSALFWILLLPSISRLASCIHAVL